MLQKDDRRKKAAGGKAGGGTQGRETKTKSTKKVSICFTLNAFVLHSRWELMFLYRVEIYGWKE